MRRQTIAIFALAPLGITLCSVTLSLHAAEQLPTRTDPTKQMTIKVQNNNTIPPDVLPEPTVNAAFGIPVGLKTRPSILFDLLGYGKPHLFSLTPVTCFDAGYKCYALGLFDDALAFANHGLTQSNHARLYLLKAICEVDLNRPDDATNTLVKYREAMLRPSESIGLGIAKERLNNPSRLRLEALLEAWQKQN